MKILTTKKEIQAIAHGSLIAVRAIFVGIDHIHPMVKQISEIDKSLAIVEANDYAELNKIWAKRKLTGLSIVEENDNIVINLSSEVAITYGNGIALIAEKASTIIAPLATLIKVSGVIPVIINWNKKMDSFFMTEDELKERDISDVRKSKLKMSIDNAVDAAKQKAQFDVTTAFKKNPDSVNTPTTDETIPSSTNVIDEWSIVENTTGNSKFIKHPITGIEIQINDINASKYHIKLRVYNHELINIIKASTEGTTLDKFAEDCMNSTLPAQLIQAIRVKYELPLFEIEEVKITELE